VRCNFEMLLECVEGRLAPEHQLEVFEHVERCPVCFDTMRELARERRGGVRNHHSRTPDAGSGPSQSNGRSQAISVADSRRRATWIRR
jgi:hypothetical protein